MTLPYLKTPFLCFYYIQHRFSFNMEDFSKGNLGDSSSVEGSFFWANFRSFSPSITQQNPF